MIDPMVLSAAKYAKLLDLLERTEGLLKEVKRPSMAVNAAHSNVADALAELKTIGVA